MLPIFVAIIARCAIVVGLALLIGRILPQNKVYRFGFLFVLLVLSNPLLAT
jgi:hypothetical protein